jgi:hypothetical protein
MLRSPFVLPLLLGCAAVAAQPAGEAGRTETLQQFLDNTADAALTRDPTQRLRTDAGRRTVDLGRGWAASLDEGPASRLASPVNRDVTAGTPDRQLRLYYAGAPGAPPRLELYAQRLVGTRQNGLRIDQPLAGGWALVGAARSLDGGGLALRRRDATIGLQRRSDDGLALFGGWHAARVDSAAADGAPLPAERANFLRLAAGYTPPEVPALTLGVQAEHALGSDDDGLLQASASYRFDGGAQLYARQAWRLSLPASEALTRNAAFRSVIGGSRPLGLTPGGQGSVYGEWRARSLASGDDQAAVVGWRETLAPVERWRLSTRIERTQPLAGPSVLASTALSVGAARSGFPDNAFDSFSEVVRSEAAQSQSVSAKYTQRMSGSWGWTLGGNAGRTHSFATGARTNDSKSQWSVAWREPDEQRLFLVGRLFRNTHGDTAAPVNDRTATIASAQFLWLQGGGAQAAQWLGRVAARRAEERANVAQVGLRRSELVVLRAVLRPWGGDSRWDVSPQFAQRRDTLDGTLRSAGVEAGYRLSRKVVLAAGVNFKGFADDELAAEDRLNRGAYLRLRFNFDVVLGRWLDAR